MPGAEGLAAKAAEAITTRDAIQANLLELDGSYGRRLLEGATLRGVTKQRWDAAAAALAGLWQTFTAYSAVIDRLAELTRDRQKREPPELAELLSGRCVSVVEAPAPLARRDLADTGRRDLTLASAVAAMRSAFGDVTEVTSAAETVWNDVGSRLDAVAGRLTAARQALAGLNDDGLTARLTAAQEDLDAQRTALNSDPLALWQRTGADTAAADRLAGEVATLAGDIAALDQLRRDAQGRIGQVRAQADELTAARQDAAAAWQRATVRIADVPPLPPATAPPPLDSLATLAATGRWRQLAAEIGRSASAISAALSQTRDTERSLVSLIAHRDELRGLLEAYKAKASRLGSAEDQDLAARYDHARELLWTAPCDLAAAAEAVTGYQQAILALEGQRR